MGGLSVRRIISAVLAVALATAALVALVPVTPAVASGSRAAGPLAPEAGALFGAHARTDSSEAAQRAGIGIVALRCGGWSDEQLRGALAIHQGDKGAFLQCVCNKDAVIV